MRRIMLVLAVSFMALSTNAAISYGDYKSTPCISVMQVAETTMKNWQNGYSNKDMLLSSLKLGGNLSEKSSMDLSDAKLLTYRMATTAMKSPVHDDDVYKNVAISKFSSDYYSICEMKYNGL